MAQPDFTVAEATDLARYFLGPDWFALRFGTDRSPGRRIHASHMLTSDGHGSHGGMSWREVFRAAGVQLPLRPQYVAQGVRVMLADRAICTAVSNTLAKRIAAALNNHIPDRRGI
jgi:hypothetical protein